MHLKFKVDLVGTGKVGAEEKVGLLGLLEKHGDLKCECAFILHWICVISSFVTASDSSGMDLYWTINTATWSDIHEATSLRIC